MHSKLLNLDNNYAQVKKPLITYHEINYFTKYIIYDFNYIIFLHILLIILLSNLHNSFTFKNILSYYI